MKRIIATGKSREMNCRKTTWQASFGDLNEVSDAFVHGLQLGSSRREISRSMCRGNLGKSPLFGYLEYVVNCRLAKTGQKASYTVHRMEPPYHTGCSQ